MNSDKITYDKERHEYYELVHDVITLGELVNVGILRDYVNNNKFMIKTYLLDNERYKVYNIYVPEEQRYKFHNIKKEGNTNEQK